MREPTSYDHSALAPAVDPILWGDVTTRESATATTTNPARRIDASVRAPRRRPSALYDRRPMAKQKSKRRQGTPPPKPSRYTAPAPKARKASPLWVPATMFTCLILGILVIVGNYLQLLPGGEAQNSYLFVGLGLMIAGFVLSTQYR